MRTLLLNSQIKWRTDRGRSAHSHCVMRSHTHAARPANLPLAGRGFVGVWERRLRDWALRQHNAGCDHHRRPCPGYRIRAVPAGPPRSRREPGLRGVVARTPRVPRCPVAAQIMRYVRKAISVEGTPCEAAVSPSGWGGSPAGLPSRRQARSWASPVRIAADLRAASWSVRCSPHPKVVP
jgi:hypothetical protein